MRKARNKKFSLVMALVFAFTMVFPFAAFAAEDNTSITGSYRYVTADDEVRAGVVRVVYDEMDADTDEVIVQLTLPEGASFTDKPSDMSWVEIDGATGEKVDAESKYFEAKFKDITADFDVKFDYGYDGDSSSDEYNEDTDVALDIDDDFTGNLEVAVEVIGLADGDIIWSDNDDVTIAKVSGGDVDVVVGDTKKVSIGGDAEVADITLEESMAGAFLDGETVTLEIETDGVEFNSVDVVPTRLTVDPTDELTEGDFTENDDDELTKLEVTVNSGSTSLPGKIKFDNILLDIAPSVTGEIEISVTSDKSKGADLDETVTVATVGDVNAEVSDIDDNDGTVYAGQDKDLDVEFKLATTDGSDFEPGDMITFELNMGEFKDEPQVDGKDAKLYDDDEAFYYTFPKDFDDDEITIDNINVILDNDAEPGDLTLTIGGDYGDLGEVTIAQVAKPFTVTAEKVKIISEALGQETGDIIITETDDGAFKDGQFLYFEMPSGVELKGKPSVEVTEGSADADIADSDDDYFVVEITEESSSKPSTLRVYDIEYDTGKTALAGDVEVEIYGDIDEENKDNEDKVDTKDWDFDDDSMLASVINATVVDTSVVTASFKLGDEGVAIQNGRMLVQVNTLTDTLGLQKSWDAASKTAYFFKNGTVVAFPIGTNQLVINGNDIPVDQGGVIIDGATYATLRGVQAAFGGELVWDDATKTATFNF